jgi:NADH-quinone oxidoreductase subunit E
MSIANQRHTSQQTKESPLSILRQTSQDRIEAILAEYPTKRAAVLPLCHLAQKTYGHMSEVAIRDVAQILELDPTEIRGLVGFYTLLRERPAGTYVIEICNDLPCALRGVDEFVDYVCQKLGVGIGETTQDGMFTLETVMCLAACDRSPVAQVDLEYRDYLTPETFDRLIDQLREAAGQSEWNLEQDDDTGTPYTT